MTQDETRQLGIEFERRVQTMIPEKEYLDKLDSETIYSFLNQYQDKYIHEIYRSLDAIPEGSKISAHVESVLQCLIRTKNISIDNTDSYDANTNQLNIYDENSITIVDTARSRTFKLPSDFYMYLKSVSKVTSTFSFKGSNDNNTQNTPIRIIPNKLVSQNDVWKLVETPHNSLRILRYPAVVLNEPYTETLFENSVKYNTMTVIYDQYTTITGVRLMYYKQPAHFDIMTSTPCELPMDAFDDLVTGAVDLYVQYVAGAEARKRQMQEAASKQQERNKEEDK